MPIDEPTRAEILALVASAGAGLLGRYLGWVRGKDASRPFSRWTVCYQLPLGMALGVSAGMLGIATGLGYWAVLTSAMIAGILGPDGVEMLLERWRGKPPTA